MTHAHVIRTWVFVYVSVCVSCFFQVGVKEEEIRIYSYKHTHTVSEVRVYGRGVRVKDWGDCSDGIPT